MVFIKLISLNNKRMHHQVVRHVNTNKHEYTEVKWFLHLTCKNTSPVLSLKGLTAHFCWLSTDDLIGCGGFLDREEKSKI